jgi:hypothetical protein
MMHPSGKRILAADLICAIGKSLCSVPPLNDIDSRKLFGEDFWLSINDSGNRCEDTFARLQFERSSGMLVGSLGRKTLMIIIRFGLM